LATHLLTALLLAVAGGSQHKRIQSGLHRANSIIESCVEPNDECYETVNHSGVLNEPFEARITVTSVTDDQFSDGSIIRGVIHAFHHNLQSYRTGEEKAQIARSIAAIGAVHTGDSYNSDASAAERSKARLQYRKAMRKHRQEHATLIRRLNGVASARQQKYEKVDVVLFTRNPPGAVAGKKRLKATIRIRGFSISPGIPQANLPPVVGTLFGHIAAMDIAGDIPLSDERAIARYERAAAAQAVPSQQTLDLLNLTIGSQGYFPRLYFSPNCPDGKCIVKYTAKKVLSRDALVATADIIGKGTTSFLLVGIDTTAISTNQAIDLSVYNAQVRKKHPQYGFRIQTIPPYPDDVP